MTGPQDQPAFPIVIDGLAEGGMTLRDYFAAKAMQSMCAGPGATMVANRDENYNESNWKEVVAMNAYEFADAMLIERNKKL